MKVMLIAVLISLSWPSGEGAADDAAIHQGTQEFPVSGIEKDLREFLRLGEKLLIGNMDVLAERTAMADRLEKRFRSFPPETWQEPRKAAVLMLAALFGGGSETLKAALQTDKLAKDFQPAASGVIAYSDRDLDAAGRHFEEMSTDAMPRDVVDALDLVHGTLLAPEQPQKAITKFVKVELAAPGTSLEEAALRQHVLSLVRIGDMAAARSKLSTYLRRFPNSVYWRQFRVQAGFAFARSEKVVLGELAADDNDFRSSVSTERYLEFLIEVARQLLMDGQMDGASELAQNILERVNERTEIQRVAELLLNLSDAAREKPDKALEKLLAMDQSRYSADERELIDAGISIAQDIKRGYQMQLSGPSPTIRKREQPSEPGRAVSTDLIEAANPVPQKLRDKLNTLFNQVDQSLKETAP